MGPSERGNSRPSADLGDELPTAHAGIVSHRRSRVKGRQVRRMRRARTLEAAQTAPRRRAGAGGGPRAAPSHGRGPTFRAGLATCPLPATRRAIPGCSLVRLRPCGSGALRSALAGPWAASFGRAPSAPRSIRLRRTEPPSGSRPMPVTIVRAGARRGLGDGGRLRARRPPGEAAAGHAALGGLHRGIACRAYDRADSVSPTRYLTALT